MTTGTSARHSIRGEGLDDGKQLRFGAVVINKLLSLRPTWHFSSSPSQCCPPMSILYPSVSSLSPLSCPFPSHVLFLLCRIHVHCVLYGRCSPFASCITFPCQGLCRSRPSHIHPLFAFLQTFIVCYSFLLFHVSTLSLFVSRFINALPSPGHGYRDRCEALLQVLRQDGRSHLYNPIHPPPTCALYRLS